MIERRVMDPSGLLGSPSGPPGSMLAAVASRPGIAQVGEGDPMGVGSGTVGVGVGGGSIGVGVGGGPMGGVREPIPGIVPIAGVDAMYSADAGATRREAKEAKVKTPQPGILPRHSRKRQRDGDGNGKESEGSQRRGWSKEEAKNPDLRRGKFTDNEDKILYEAVRRYVSEHSLLADNEDAEGEVVSTQLKLEGVRQGEVLDGGAKGPDATTRGGENGLESSFRNNEAGPSGGFGVGLDADDFAGAKKAGFTWTNNNKPTWADLKKYSGQLLKTRGSGAWREIAKALPTRSVKSVWRHCVAKLHPYQGDRKAQRAWTAEDEVQLKEMVDTMGNNWKEIGAKLGRFPEACRLKYRDKLSKKFKKGNWSAEEDESLTKHVHDSLAAKRAMESSMAGTSAGLDAPAAPFELDPNQPISIKSTERDGIDWAAIAEKMGNRSPTQCIIRWYRSLQPLEAGTRIKAVGSAKRASQTIWDHAQDKALVTAVLKVVKRDGESGTTGFRWMDVPLIADLQHNPEQCRTRIIQLARFYVDSNVEVSRDMRLGADCEIILGSLESTELSGSPVKLGTFSGAR